MDKIRVMIRKTKSQENISLGGTVKFGCSVCDMQRDTVRVTKSNTVSTSSTILFLPMNVPDFVTPKGYMPKHQPSTHPVFVCTKQFFEA